MDRRNTRRALASALALLLMACGGPRVLPDVVDPLEDVVPAVATAETAGPRVASASAATVLEIALPGDGRAYTHALGQDEDEIALLANDGAGVTHHAIDVDAGTAAQVRSVALEAYPEHATYDRARGLFWGTTPGEQERIRVPGAHGELVLTRSQRVVTPAGMRGEIRACPEPAPPSPQPRARGERRGGILGRGLVGHLLGAGRPRCDHRITALLPVSSGLLIGGSIAIDSIASPRPWLGIVSPEGTLLGATTLDAPAREGWVDGLVAADAGVFAFVWSRAGSTSRGALVLLREGTLELVMSTSIETMSSSSQPWSVMAAAPDGGLWMVVPRFGEQLVLVVVGRDGAIVREQTIQDVSLPVTSTQHLAVRGGEPWLAISEPYAESGSRLRLARLDSVSGAVLERHDVALPDRFYAERVLATERGYALAGRVDMARPAVLWITLPAAP